jgi:hypothetical protein
MTKNPRRVTPNSTRKKKGTSQKSALQKKAQSDTLSSNPRFETIPFYFMFFERRKPFFFNSRQWLVLLLGIEAK